MIDRREGRTKTGNWAILIIYELWEWGGKDMGYKVTATSNGRYEEKTFRYQPRGYVLRAFESAWRKLLES